MTQPAVKICGVCRAGDAALADEAGADYVGVILSPGRRRSLSAEEAAAVLSATSAQRVGVFVDAPAAEVLHVTERLGLDVLQLHGSEPPELAARLANESTARVWKAVAVRSPADVRQAIAAYGRTVHGLLLEGWSSAGHGGVGATFDWAAARAVRREVPVGVTLIVAGGLNPGNVAQAMELLAPDVVDVSSGVESAPCRKSRALVQAFMGAARGAARTQGP
jgi:phosphoribosylanthranilate isomerase